MRGVRCGKGRTRRRRRRRRRMRRRRGSRRRGDELRRPTVQYRGSQMTRCAPNQAV